MYDTASVTEVANLPDDGIAYAGYLAEPGQQYVTFPAIVKRFWPHKRCVSLGMVPNSLAEFLDVEPGNPVRTSAGVRASFEFRLAHRVYRPGFYADQSDMADIVIPGLAGIPRSEYRLFVANPTGVLHLPPGYDACQCRWTDAFDVSVLADDFFPPVVKRRPWKR